MDTLLFPASNASWNVDMADGDCSTVGIVKDEKGSFVIEVQAGSSPLSGVDAGPHDSLEVAMAAIGSHLNGSCDRYASLPRPA